MVAVMGYRRKTPLECDEDNTRPRRHQVLKLPANLPGPAQGRARRAVQRSNRKECSSPIYHALFWEELPPRAN